MLLDNEKSTQDDARTRAALLVAVIGSERVVTSLTENDVRQYEARRRAGGIRYGEKVTGAVTQRSAQADLKLLQQMLRWACTRTMPDGQPWLATQPLQYVRVKGQTDVRREVASYERFEATRGAMRRFQQRYEDEMKACAKPRARERARLRMIGWIRAEFALMLLEATGKRRGSIMGLHWSDIDFVRRRMTWQRRFDKKRKTWTTVYPESLFETIRGFQRRIRTVGGYVFSRAHESEEPAPPALLSQWIRKAEKEAGLSKLAGTACHGYRRKWRTERNHLPMKAVAVAGGWSDVSTMLRCYDQPDDADVLAVTSESRKRREKSIA